MTDMVGIGPFVVLSIVAQTINGPGFLYAWLAGALLSIVDAMVWSQLGATYPLAGGSYNFLKEGYGPRWGKLMSFLFVWQTMIQAPLVIASAAIGFAQYAGYLTPLNDIEHKVVSGTVVIMIVFSLQEDRSYWKDKCTAMDGCISNYGMDHRRRHDAWQFSCGR